jgi:hypothetical protein
VNTAAPTVGGQAYVGKTLTTSRGSWLNGPTSYKYAWARCDGNGNGCTQIAGATATTYVATSADLGHTLESSVTASNSAGSAGPVDSKPTAVITPATKPVLATRPAIIGKPVVGQQLVAQPGTYSGGAVSGYGYQWERCDAGTLTCASISGATKQDYQVGSADLASRLRVQVTAANPFGRTTNPSTATDLVVNQVVVVTPTLHLAKTATVCCQTLQLSGSISPAHAGEKIITVLARQFDALATTPVTTATTDASGNWSAIVTPTIATTYTAQTATATSDTATVSVHPRVGFGVNGNTFTAKVAARDTFAGRIAYLQRRTASGWKPIRLVVINRHSVAKFPVSLKRGRTYTLRIYLTKAQAGGGYLDGTSIVQRGRWHALTQPVSTLAGRESVSSSRPAGNDQPRARLLRPSTARCS